MKIASSVDNLASCGMSNMSSSNTSINRCTGVGGTSSSSATMMMSRRSTLSGRGKYEEVPAGRISHWAVSFDNLLSDPLGITHFKVRFRSSFLIFYSPWKPSSCGIVCWIFDVLKLCFGWTFVLSKHVCVIVVAMWWVVKLKISFSW